MAKKSLKERLLEKQEAMKKGNGDFDFYIIPAGTTRFRILPFNQEDGDFSIEATTFFLDKQTIISPVTFGDECPIMEAYNELKASKDPDDKALAEKLKPKKKYFAPALKYKDTKGAEIDPKGAKLVAMPASIGNALIDLFLEEEAGDFTDARKGYDTKFKRTGTTMTDTEYSVLPCKPTSIPKDFRKDYSAEEMLKEITKPYEELKVLVEKFLKLDPEDGEDKKDRKKNRNKERDRSSSKSSKSSKNRKGDL